MNTHRPILCRLTAFAIVCAEKLIDQITDKTLNGFTVLLFQFTLILGQGWPFTLYVFVKTQQFVAIQFW